MSDDKVNLNPHDFLGMAQRGCSEVYSHLQNDIGAVNLAGCINRLEEVIARLNVLLQAQTAARAQAQNGAQAEQRAN